MKEELAEYWLSIEYHSIQRPKRISVIARSVDDAKQIATRLFKQDHTEDCVIDSVRDVSAPMPPLP